MIWLHPALLFGLGLTAIPVVLHLLMRAKPKKLVFPALRLIQNRKRTNVRRLRLRHLALLLLRMALLALVVLAVARPSVPAADYAPHAGEWLRLALIAGIIATIYAALLAWWRRGGLATHELVYRRSYLRAILAAVALLALAVFVAWPYQRRIAAAITQPTLAPNEFLPVAAVMLFDTSLSMQYRHESRTRLELAQEIASRHLGNLPRGSRVAVGETAGDGLIRFQGDLSAGVKRIAALSPQPLARPLDDRLLTAIEAQLEDQERATGASDSAPSADLLREIYIFTDLAQSGWRADQGPRLQEALTRAAAVSVYLIDVGVANPTNLALTGLSLSEQSAPRGRRVALRAALQAVGSEPGPRVVELHLENASGKLVKAGQESPTVDSSAAATATFSIPAAGGPVVQGELRLQSSDPLPFDDVRTFTLLVRPPAEVLVVAETRGEARILMEMLAPGSLSTEGRARYRCRYLTPGQFSAANLSKAEVVCLVNVADPQPAGWKALTDYVSAGGSALIILGDQVRHAAYLSPLAGGVLPGDLQSPLSFDVHEFLDLDRTEHPLLKRLGDVEGAFAGLTSAAIRNYWSVTPAARDTAVIARYTHFRRGPALLERAVGNGRVLLLTTSLDGRWNDLPLVWQTLALADQMLQHLSRSAGDVFNYTIGETVHIALAPAQPLPAYLLRKPGLQQLRSEIPPGATSLTISDADQLGSYRLSAADPALKFERGFSVNPDESESDLRRLTKDDLDQRLGADRYSLARDIENLERNVRAGRLGREAFPILALLLLAAFLGEHVVANRFYAPEPQAAEVPSRALGARQTAPSQ